MITATHMAPQPMPYVQMQGEINSKYPVHFSLSNCKLAHFESFDAYVGSIKDEDVRKRALDAYLATMRGRCVFVTVTTKATADWLKKTYTCYYCHTVPIGYGTCNQYHVLIKNNDDKRKPIEPEAQKVLPIKEVLEIVTGAFEMSDKRAERLQIIENKLKQLTV